MSGRKNNLLKYALESAHSMGASFNSPVTNIQFLDNIGIQVNILSGAPNGELQIQVSADFAQDYLGNITNAGNWVTLSTASQVITAGSPAQVYFDLNQLSAPWIRLHYERTSGTGSMDAFITAKML